jgi:purine nucleosidase
MNWKLPLLVLVSITTLGATAPTRILIDADTANEVDDAFAIVRAIIEPSFKIVGLNSTQWQVSHYATPETLIDSQRMNTAILDLLNRRDIPHPHGAYRRLHDWGADVAQHSAAAYHIIKEAHATPQGEKLIVAVLGAQTNLASALLIDPSIAPKLSVHLLGTSYDFEQKIWRKRDFNCVMDIQAIEVVLDQPDLDLHVIPVNVASAMKFGREEMDTQLKDKHPVADYLRRVWLGHNDGSRTSRTIWDLAVITCLIDPSMGEVVTVARPPENGGAPISVYRSVDGAAIRAEFYETLAHHIADNSSS